jgi:hypothetical protein
MSEALHALYKSKGVMGLLRAFGLHQVLTARDDPALWAAALVRHWHAPGEAELQPAALRFGVSRPVPDDEARDVRLARSGMEALEEWCFERVEAGLLRVVDCKEQSAPSFMGMLMGGDPPAAASDTSSWVRDYLEVSRPSLGASRALVHAGMSAPPNAGSGETRVWARVDDGTWIETDEVLARWLA